MGCDIVRIKDIQRDQISIHAPTWGATTSGSQAWLIGAFQSTHPHGVRPVNHKGVLGVERISIHAPTWGATRRACTSIHRPQTSFQSTHPHGVRQLQVRVDQQTLDISIHAPTWGATRGPAGHAGRSRHHFNPRTHMGCDRIDQFDG